LLVIFSAAAAAAAAAFYIAHHSHQHLLRVPYKKAIAYRLRICKLIIVVVPNVLKCLLWFYLWGKTRFAVLPFL